jgi:Pyruvate/2-oxoacid:ferredoxin oxidoreductase delta subunit
MGLFKAVKKPVIKSGGGGAEVSALRPRFEEKPAPCIVHCPNGGDVREWLVMIAQHEAHGRTPAQAFEAAWRRITEKNPFPAIVARVCSHPCEQSCNRKEKDGAVGIHLLERFVGDYAAAQGWQVEAAAQPMTAKVAVVGAGPAGLACAYHLVRRGYPVTVLDAAPKSGGMMRYRLPRSVVPEAVLEAEVGRLAALGVEFRNGCVVGRDVSVEELRRDYAAVFFAIGLLKPAQMEVKQAPGGGAVVGELPAEAPEVPAAEVAEMDKRVLNTVSPAVAQGRHVADAIDACLQGKPYEPPVKREAIKADKVKLAWYPAAAPHAEVALEAQLSEAEAVAEAKRCLSCGMCMDCETCWMYCTANAFVKLPQGEHYRIKTELCNGCSKCADACPCGYISMN